MHAKALGSYGSFNTVLGILNGQTGDLDTDGFGTVRVMANMQYQHSDGALTGQDLYTHNELLKIQDQLGAHWTITLFADQSFLKENLDDNNGATPAQVAVYGKNFALQNTNAALPTYTPYNFTIKAHRHRICAPGRRSAFRLQARQYGVHLRVLEPHAQPEQPDADAVRHPEQHVRGQLSEPAEYGRLHVRRQYRTDAFQRHMRSATAILGYSKENAYRVYGDILRLSEDYDFGWIDGQVRGGVWIESQATHRFKYYFDSVTCGKTGTDVFDVGDVAANAVCGVAYKPFKSSYYNGPVAANANILKAKSIEVRYGRGRQPARLRQGRRAFGLDAVSALPRSRHQGSGRPADDHAGPQIRPLGRTA